MKYFCTIFTVDWTLGNVDRSITITYKEDRDQTASLEKSLNWVFKLRLSFLVLILQINIAYLNAVALRTAKTPYIFGRSDCNRVKISDCVGALSFYFCLFDKS